MCRRDRRLVWLQALDPIWVDFPVPEAIIGKFTIGSAIELAADAFPGRSFKGEVEAFDARLSQDSADLDGAGEGAQSRSHADARHVRQRRRARGRGEGFRHGAAHGGDLRSLWR